MKFLRNRTKTASIAFVLMLTIAATFMTCLPAVNAQVYLEIPTYAYITAVPSPIGVGQMLLVTFWIDKVPTTAIAGYDPVRNWGGFVVTITKPNGNVETKGPVASDAVSSNWFSYVPDTVGTYYFQFSWPGQYKNETVAGVRRLMHYQGATSRKLAVAVQQEPIQPYPLYTLDPNEYWTRPIEGEIRDAWSFSGNWIFPNYNASYIYGGFNPYTKAPNSPHIVWAKPIAFGGIVGGEFGDYAYYEGHTYEVKFTPPLIIQGRLYYHIPRSNNPTGGGLVCVDIRTGEQLWYKNITVSNAQLLSFESPNQHGVLPYLWSTGSTYEMFDAFTGQEILRLTNARTGTVTTSPRGDMLVYILNGAQNWLALWNSTKCIPSGTSISWRPSPGVYDWRNGIQWNKTVPDVPGVQAIGRGNWIVPNTILAWTGGLSTRTNNVTYLAYDAKTGAELWRQNITVPTWSTQFGSTNIDITSGVFCRFEQSTMQWYGYDLFTGRKIWGPTEPWADPWGLYQETEYNAYGKFYTMAFDGMIHCYNLKTGEHLWDYYSGNAGLETPYGTWPFYIPSKVLIADGKIFVSNNEHSPSKPLERGFRLHAVNAETGQQVWSILGWMSDLACADGYMVGYNSYDMQVYCFGKGKTATTVSASPKVIADGSSVLIEGTVLDQSPGAEGTPCVSDKSMEQWMEYLYYQHPCPANATGVPVKVQAFSSDGTMIDIGTVTSDLYGQFKVEWTPPDKDLYTIMATFAGSESYWTSYGVTGLSVGPAPAEPEPVEIPAYPDYTPLFAGIIVAVVIAIVIGLVNLLWKRK